MYQEPPDNLSCSLPGHIPWNSQGCPMGFSWGMKGVLKGRSKKAFTKNSTLPEDGCKAEAANKHGRPGTSFLSVEYTIDIHVILLYTDAVIGPI